MSLKQKKTLSLPDTLVLDGIYSSLSSIGSERNESGEGGTPDQCAVINAGLLRAIEIT